MIIKSIENKDIVWFSQSNSYLVVEKEVSNVLQSLNEKKSIETIASKIAKELDVPNEVSVDFVNNIEHEIFIPNTTPENIDNQNNADTNTIPSFFEVKKYYQINEVVFEVDFLSEFEVFLIHPKFSHLEITSPSQKIEYHYQVFTDHGITTFFVNNKKIGSWERKNIHYFQGKFSMKIVEHTHKMKEHHWLGVFHASAIANKEKSMLFFGESGNGKSTSLALLQANGYTCLADDFVPVSAEKQEVYSFPAAISIKKNSVDTLLPFYPELKDKAEFHFKTMGKIVRYLETNNKNYSLHLPCKAFVFIKYEKDSGISINKLNHVSAFEKLVPDSWVSNDKANVQLFLNWFNSMPCYEIIYSDNDQMIASISKIFTDEL